jgi:NAD(P)-dependent dehydrogenase (short-subunit alcohol dehydrogenase family)
MPVAIVSGSDSGIGKATAVVLAEQGWDVGITWHEDEDGARGTADEVRGVGRRAEVSQLDLTRLDEVQPVIGALADALGGVNACQQCRNGTSTPFLELELDEWRRVLDGLGLLTKVMALELAEHGITVNAVAPGEIATPMTYQEDEDVSAKDRPAIPLGRPGDAREIAAVIAFLCSP